MTDFSVKLFEDHVMDEGWKRMAKEYLVRKTNIVFLGNIPLMIMHKTKNLGGLAEKIFPNSTIDHYHRAISIEEYSPQELFTRNHDVKFKMKTDLITNPCKQGDCGFILRVTAATGERDDSFNIQLVIESDIYPGDIHFHKESLSVENMHLTLDITEGRKKASCNDASDNGGEMYINLPVTWQGKPHRDGSSKYWCWGSHHFYSEHEGLMPAEESFIGRWFWGSAARIRLVVYYMG
jgi:hypothetical protein